MKNYGTIPWKYMLRDLTMDLLKAPEVAGQRWHAMDVSGNPMLVSREIHNFTWEGHIPHYIRDLQAMVVPNLPWAEDHFQERISGQPLNPAPSEAWWPFAMKGNEVHKDEKEQFSHTYPERMWPKFANEGQTRPNGRQVSTPHNGIRYEYGDLMDVIELLVREPTTRQAFLPIWFPEDTGATAGQRLPCSLGYHFMIRNDMLHVSYYMRSCDFIRHFRDDVYMAMRLGQHVAGAVNHFSSGREDQLVPGSLYISIASLHCFKGDEAKMKRGEV